MRDGLIRRYFQMICVLFCTVFVTSTVADERPRRENDEAGELGRRIERTNREEGENRNARRTRQERDRPENSREYHLRAAIRHLRAAGLGEEAQRLERSVTIPHSQENDGGRRFSDRQPRQERQTLPNDRFGGTIRHLQHTVEQLSQRVRSSEELEGAVDLAHRKLDELRERAEEVERHFGHQIKDLERSTHHRLEDFERELLGTMERMERELIRKVEEFEREAAERWHDDDNHHDDDDDDDEN